MNLNDFLHGKKCISLLPALTIWVHQQNLMISSWLSCVAVIKSICCISNKSLQRCPTNSAKLCHTNNLCVSAEVKVQAICWCWETSSSLLLLFIQVNNKKEPTSGLLTLIRSDSIVSCVVKETNSFFVHHLIQRSVMPKEWMTCAAGSWRFLTRRSTLSGVSPATWRDSPKISGLMVCTEK